MHLPIFFRVDSLVPGLMKSPFRYMGKINHYLTTRKTTKHGPCAYFLGPLYQVSFNTLRPRQNGQHFPDVIFKCIFLNENVWILIKISLKFLLKGPINNIPALVQIKAWRWPGDKPLSEPMMASLLTHICVTRPQWVNWNWGMDM